MNKTLFFALFLSLALAASGKVIYVAPDGDDAASGSLEAPMATLPAAYGKIAGGDTVCFRGGTYLVTDEQVMKIESLYAHTFALEKAGTKEGLTCFMGYPGERPVFDFSALQLDGAHRFTGFYLGADYIHLRNFDIVGLPVRITGHTQSECVSARKGSHCIVENIAMYNNMAIGYYQTKGSDNLVLNCDAYNNYDDYSEGVYGGNVDGFGIHVKDTDETGNRIVGCRAWRNSDDGFDLISCATAVEISHCVALFNGYRPADDLTTFLSAGDGNGFKAGGWGMSVSVTKCPEVCPSHYVHHCLAYKNKANGFYSNHHLTGNTWEYNSASENRSNYEMLNRYANTAEGAYDVPGYDHVLRHNVSWTYRDKGHVTNYDTETCTMENNSFLPEDSAFTVTADMFVSTDVAGLLVKRNADGTLPEIQFMRGLEGSVPAKRQMGWCWEEAERDTTLLNLPVEEPVGEAWKEVNLKRKITHAQPMTGIAVWPWKAKDIHSSYGQCIQLEFNYFKPSEMVKGCNDDGTIIYDWSSFDDALSDVASRGHQLVARFYYEYPGSPDEDPAPTVVPQYIKQLSDYNETYSKSAGTYYADWSNAELQRFTIEFYTAFAKRYARDPRLAFLEVGFGHWSEYHIYPTTVVYGKNFPSKEYQKKFLLHLSEVCDGLPWLISKNAADNSSIPSDKEVLALRFGMFEDSFMGKYFAEGGYEQRWNSISKGTRWQTGVCGGEISLENNDQLNFLRPEGLYGYTFEETATKYHFSFAICNAVTNSEYGTPARVKQASLSTGYRYVVKRCATDGIRTRLLVSNEGIAPLYRDAYFAIGDVRSEASLQGLLPNEEIWIEIAAQPNSDGQDIKIVSDHILPRQEIQFEANIDSTNSMKEIPAYLKKESCNTTIFNLSGQQIPYPQKGINLIGGRKIMVK